MSRVILSPSSLISRFMPSRSLILMAPQLLMELWRQSLSARRHCQEGLLSTGRGQREASRNWRLKWWNWCQISLRGTRSALQRPERWKLRRNCSRNSRISSSSSVGVQDIAIPRMGISSSASKIMHCKVCHVLFTIPRFLLLYIQNDRRAPLTLL